MDRHELWISSMVVLLITTGASGDGLIVIDPVEGRPPDQHYPFAPLEVKYHHVEVRIEGQVAITSVDQVFHNPLNQRLEGTYLFPVPKGAGLDRFTMDVGGKQMEAELLDANKARKIYEDIVRRAKDPALMEYVGRDLIKVRIFPIEPRSDKRITLKYTQVLERDSGLVEFLYPLNTEKFSSQPIHSVSVKVELTTKKPLKSVYCPSHQVEIDRQGLTKAVIGFEARDVRPDTDFQLFFATEGGRDIGVNMLSYWTEGDEGAADGDEGFFMLLSSPGELGDEGKVIEKDVVFVLDTSGSMAGGKFDQAKRALKFCLENLNEGDRFEIIRFSTEAEALFHELVGAEKPNLDKARAFVESLRPMGGTAIEEALLAATRVFENGKDARPATIIFLTDGRPTIGQTDEDSIVSTVAGSAAAARIFCFGIGTEVNTHLLDKVTEKTRAYSQYVLPTEDIEVKVSRFYTKIDSPVLSGLQLSFKGGPRAGKMHPADLPDLFKGDQLVLFGRYSGHGDTAVILEGTVNGQKQSFTYEAEFRAAGKATEHDFIPRLWASRRVGYLLEQIRLHGDNKELRDEVTRLARSYGIVTPYTSYLIVEDEARRNVPVVQRTMPRLEADEASIGLGRRAWDQYKGQRGGELAVRGSRATSRLKFGNSIAGVAAAAGEANDSLTTGFTGRRDAAAAKRLVAQQARFVRGRTFFRNGDEWTDSRVQSRPRASVVEVEFNSDDYFALLRNHPHAANWLSVGRKVRLLLGDTVYVVR